MQATQLIEQPKSESGARLLPGNAPGTSFVINLCSSTSPVALAPPDHAGLKRFTFFVSRRREEGRERFRLHMGYFTSQEEAEKLLDIVREIYPGAWAGLAPGQRLRAAAAAATSSGAAPIEQEVAPTVAAAASAPMPTVASPPAPVAVATAAQADVKAPPVAEIVSFDLIPDRPRRLPDAVPEVSTIVADVAPAVEVVPTVKGAKSEHEAATRSLNDVRAAIASLEDTAARAPTLRVIPELKAAANIPIAMPAKPVEAPKKPEAAKPIELAKPIEAKPADVVEELNDEAAMEMLENGAKEAPKAASGAAPSTEKAVFAVQLMWSVQPIDVAQVPQLAIFSAYTLYGAEGNRDGRRWYGLRLGFFTDAVSAKQVAHYVRSEFSTVSVVPVTMREKERAKIASNRPGELTASAPVAPAKVVANLNAPVVVKAVNAAGAAPGAVRPAAIVSGTQFEFIEDKPLQAATSAQGAGKAPNARPPLGPRTGRGAPGKRAKLRTPAQQAARAKSKKLTLEETLEILGAGDLKMDDGKGTLINNDAAANNSLAAARTPQPKGKPSRLGRLFERLSERIGS